MVISSKFQPSIDALTSLQQDTASHVESIVNAFWDQVSFENKARKDQPRDERSATPGFHRPTKLSLQIKRRDGALYVNWITQDSRYKKATPGKAEQPYKTYVPKGASTDSYTEASLVKHMSGWERELVLETEAKLADCRTTLKAISSMLTTLRRLEKKSVS